MLGALQHFPNQEMDLCAAFRRRLLEAGGGEEDDGGDAAEIPPVIPVRSESDGGVIVPEDSACGGIRPIGEHGVVLGEALFRRGGRGDDDDREAAEEELHDGAVLLGQSSQRAVRHRFEEVEMTDHRQHRRAWRRIPVLTWLQ